MYKRYGQSRTGQSRKTVEMPTGAVPMQLIQESTGAPPPPAEVILNSPAYTQDCWRVDCFRKLPGEFWRSVKVQARFQSRDMLDDFDMFHAEPGWRVFGTQQELAKALAAHTVAFVTIAEQQEERRLAKIAAAEREAAGKLARETSQAERKVIEARIAALEAEGFIRTGYEAAFITPGPGQQVIADWKSGSDYLRLVEMTDINGARAYSLPHGGYDDHRQDMLVSAEIALAAWQQRQQRYSDTPAKAREWLAKYAGCVGAEYYRWLAEQPEEAQS